jgi:hypothetical protein
MRLMVCPRLGVSLYRKAPVTHFVSLIDPDERETPLHPPKSTTHQLQLIFNDLDDIAKGVMQRGAKGVSPCVLT